MAFLSRRQVRQHYEISTGLTSCTHFTPRGLITCLHPKEEESACGCQIKHSMVTAPLPNIGPLKDAWNKGRCDRNCGRANLGSHTLFRSLYVPSSVLSLLPLSESHPPRRWPPFSNSSDTITPVTVVTLVIIATLLKNLPRGRNSSMYFT